MTIKEKILEEIKDINYAYNDSSKYETIKLLLDEMEEVRHAEWLHEQLALPLSDGSKECVRCSSCLTHWDNESNYCPYCGADMREERKITND